MIRFGGVRASKDLIDHLNANKLHYSQAIYRSLDASSLALLLSPFSYKGKPLVQLIDPTPVTIAGNYLVFKMHEEESETNPQGEEVLSEWGNWLKDHGITKSRVKTDLTPLPSGGVFAEAVLGRYNAAEKLDMTRFWNWQDSPIPITAPEIAPVELTSRGATDDLKPGQLGAPVVSIVNPTALPDPTSMSAVLQAIQNGNMFRDMSGLAATLGLAQAGINAASQGATAAGAQAGSNAATAAQLLSDLAKTAASVMTLGVGGALGGAAGGLLSSGGGSSSGGNISNAGALINHGRSLAERGAGGAGGNSGGQSGVTGGGGLTPSGGGSGGGGASPANSGGSADLETQAFNRALWGQAGESQSEMLRGLLQPIAIGGGDAGTPDAGATTGQSKELPPVPAPSTIVFPPVKKDIPISQHPALMTTCPANAFFGDPPTRNQFTRGTVLSATEAMQRQNDIIKAIAAAKSVRPLSAANLQHWLNGTGSELVMSSAPFKKTDSEVPGFLHGKARDEFETGCKERLKNSNHPQGTLRPATLTPGAKGPIRFLQYRDGAPRPSSTATALSQDLSSAVGAFNVHSAIWAQATFIKKEGGILGLGGDDVFEVEILHWCVQIYDVYDWNAGAATPFPISDADLAAIPLPSGAVTVRPVGFGMNMVTIKDSYFRDLEVSGIGRAYLIRTDAFDAPTTATGKFTIKI